MDNSKILASRQVSTANALFESIRKLIEDDVTELNWISRLEEELIELPMIYSKRNIVGDVEYMHIDYARQLIQRQHYKNKDFLREYANVITSDIAWEIRPSKDELLRDSLRSFFAVELIYKCAYSNLIKENDPVFLRRETLRDAVLGSLFQTIPSFKYLKALFHLIEEEKNNYFNVIAHFMEKDMCLGPIHVDNHHIYEEAEHFLAFLHNMWVRSSGYVRAMLVKIGGRTGPQQLIQSAIELQRAQVRFKGVERPTFHICFSKGILEIPVLSITSDTYHFLEKFILYEKKSCRNAIFPVTDYCVFMSCLIHTPQDVKILRESGIIKNYLHNDQDVVDLFGKLGERVPSSTHFCYSDLFDELNAYCAQMRNTWAAILRRHYFREDNRVEVISFVIAVYILLLVAILHTIYTILSYYKGRG